MLLHDARAFRTRKEMARMTKTGCGAMSTLARTSTSSNDWGQPSRNGNNAGTETTSQLADNNRNNRVFGRPTVSRPPTRNRALFPKASPYQHCCDQTYGSRNPRSTRRRADRETTVCLTDLRKLLRLFAFFAANHEALHHLPHQSRRDCITQPRVSRVANPEGITSLSPAGAGLRGTSYPGNRPVNSSTLKRGTCRANLSSRSLGEG
jgi:hypothetical protein